MEEIPKKGERMQLDVGTWTHPGTRERMQFLMMIDEGGQFRTGNILLQHPSTTAGWKEVVRG